MFNVGMLKVDTD